MDGFLSKDAFIQSLTQFIVCKLWCPCSSIPAALCSNTHSDVGNKAWFDLSWGWRRWEGAAIVLFSMLPSIKADSRCWNESNGVTDTKENSVLVVW